MREGLVEILRCLECRNSSFSLEKDEYGQEEIKRGKVFCMDCMTSYQIEDGIVNFLRDTSEGIMRESRAMDADEYITDEDGNKYRITNETINKFKKQFLSLPEGDGSYFFKMGGSFQNIVESSSRFYSTLDDLGLTGEESILEIGACFSYASFKFAKKKCKVVAIDISNYLKAAKFFIEEAYFDRIFSDMHNMPFVDNTFDIVFGSAVLHHSKDLVKVFREIHRVLRPGGRLVLINESARGVFEKVHPVFEEMYKKGFQDTSYTIPEWKKNAQKSGFKKVRIDLLSLVDDYIMRHKNRASKETFKLRFTYFVKQHPGLERCLSFLLLLPRVLFRPKSWRLVGYKHR